MPSISHVSIWKSGQQGWVLVPPRASFRVSVLQELLPLLTLPRRQVEWAGHQNSSSLFRCPCLLVAPHGPFPPAFSLWGV